MLSSSNILSFIIKIAPGLILSCAVTILAVAFEALEYRLFGRAWLEALVLAILLGAAIRSLFNPSPRFSSGINFSAKILLEIAVVLLGASLSANAVAEAGLGLVAGIAVVVILAIGISYMIGRLLKLPHNMAVLIACGNSICGNSAIAATAPVIGANSDDVAASITFTAILGVVVVLSLPLLVPLLNLSFTQYGVLAGLTVYAVPQVLAATAPVATLSVQLGTLVKLLRVLMLGPVILILAFITGKRQQNMENEGQLAPVKLRFFQLVPWFIIGFVVMLVLNSLNAIPAFAAPFIEQTSNWLTVIAMAALGLGVNIRSVAALGGRVTFTAILSLLAIGILSLGLIMLLQVT